MADPADVQLSTLLFGMTITLAKLVLPQVRGSLSETQDEIAWVITLNLVATAEATSMSGWLSSRSLRCWFCRSKPSNSSFPADLRHHSGTVLALAE
jgi:hypothetical protein